MSAQDKYSLQERGRFKAWWDAARPLEGSAFPYEIAWAAWQAALSAQPSLGGQGNGPWPEIDMILADAYSAGAEGLQFEGIARRAAVRAAVAANTARQPEYLYGSEELRAGVEGERAAYLEGLEEGKSIAARQPVGEPVAWISRIRCVGPEYGKEIYGKLPVQSLNPLYYEHIPLYAAPVQAVDLGAVREAVRKAWQKCAAGESVDLQFGTLLALIDSMAAGNG